MKVIVIGLGSMGKRRIRLIKQIDNSIEICGVDSREDRRNEVFELYAISTCATLEEAISQKCDCAFVCTSPLAHGKLIEICLNSGLNVFTEINLVDDNYDVNMELAKRMNKVLFLSSTFLYRDEIKYIQKKVNESQSLLSYSYHIGQYLPDWHPWESYTDYFIGDTRTNGCREIMAIDFPWIYETFGRFTDIKVKKNKKTRLTTTYDDSYLLLVEHENGVQGTILVDVVTRKAGRNLEIFGEDLYVSWNGSADSLKEYDINNKVEKSIDLYQNESVEKQEGYASFVVENAYKNEIIAFFDSVNNGVRPIYGFEEDKYILGVIDEIEGK